MTNDHKCFAIGRKDYGRLGLGDIEDDVDKLTSINTLEDKNVVQLECGESCSFALTQDGKVFSWGMGSNGQLGYNIFTWILFKFLFSNVNMTFFSLGSDEDQFEPVLLTGAQVKEKHVIRVSSGGQHTLFLAENAGKNSQILSNGVHQESEKTIVNGTLH